MAPHVVIVGNIGAGKSTLLERLAPALGVPPAPQRFEDNPFLQRFYTDPHQWAFRSQLWFTADSVELQARIARDGRGAVQEQMLLSTHRVMTRAIREEGHISDEEMGTLDTLVGAVSDRLPPPDVVVRVRARTAVLLERIRARGRQFERGIEPRYLERIDVALEELEATWPVGVLTIDTEHLDVRTDDGLAGVVERVRAALG